MQYLLSIRTVYTVYPDRDRHAERFSQFRGRQMPSPTTINTKTSGMCDCVASTRLAYKERTFQP